MTSDADTIPWREWSADAFACAAAERKPVLLAIGPTWCRGTEEMDRGSYRDGTVVRIVSERFVAVRVDPDRRPDISERYTLERWPTTAFLTPAGELLGGGTYLDPARLVAVLRQVVAALETRPAGVAAATVQAAAAAVGHETGHAALDLQEAVVWLDGQLHAAFDQTWAGFGPGAKRVESAALKAALLRIGRASPDQRGALDTLANIVTSTLDAIAGGGLVDRVEGGFFRYCEEPDWSRPHVEKVLTVNAQVIDLFLSASRILDQPRYAQQGAEAIRFVHDRFADTAGGFFTSQRADPAYSALTTLEERGRHGEPPVDRSVYVDATAVMATAYVLGASVLDDRSLLEFAATAVDRVVLDTYERGAGVGHSVTGTRPVRGLLGDHVAASAALLDLYEACGQDVYLDLPQELMAYCQAEMWDEGAGFRDRARAAPAGVPALGLLQEPHRPFELNCRAAVVLGRLAVLAEQPAYRDLGLRTLASQQPLYQARGLDGAAFVLALEQLETLDAA